MEIPSIPQRQRVIDQLRQDAIITPGLPEDVLDVLSTHEIRHEDTFEFSGVWEPGYIGIGNGNPGGRMNWDAAGNLNKPELVDSFFHEVQHGRDPRKTIVDHPSTGATPEFQSQVDELKNIFNQHWGVKWK
ncbi:hypothetical protein [Agarilytica rhodophyticola]|uniref:hypothetical protein n=1 Tax=Agarilytica rhodophyticola TaxID=1737490 RepID=UPI000B34222E|nr:hypothetical protein [Agarilytica rhodophyticola]